MIRFFCEGVPKSMQLGGSVAFRRNGVQQHFQAKRNSEWGLMVGQVGRAYAPAQPLDGPVTFVAKFYLPRPASLSKKVLFPTKRPDLDNLTRKLSDHFNGIFYADDSQIVDFVTKKRYAVGGRCGVEIVVARVNEDAIREAL